MNPFRKLRALFFRKKFERDMAEKMEAHLRMKTQAVVEDGASPVEARYAARRAFGGAAQIKEHCRDQRSWLWLEQMLGDFRFAARALRKAPGFSATVVVTLSLGIGLVTAIINVAHPILLPDLAFPESDRLVFLRERAPDATGLVLPSLPRLTTYAERSTSFAAWGTERGEVYHLLVGETPEVVRTSVVSSGLFPLLGVTCVQGRLFSPEEYEPGHAGESVVLSYTAWTKYFGQAKDLVGRDIRLDGRPIRVIGILAREFRMDLLFDGKDGIFITSTAAPSPNSSWAVFPLGRLKPGVTLAQAEAELIAGRPESQSKDSIQAKLRPVLLSAADAFRKDRATPFRVLLGAGALLHLIGCTAVANLMLSRAAARRRELSVRLALGGGQIRIMSLLLIEALMLAALCGAGGAFVAAWAQRMMAVLAPAGMEAAQLLEQAVFGRTFAFALALSVITCLLSAAVPTWRASRVELNEALKEGAGSLGDSRRLSFLRGLFVVVQSALAVTLLVGAGLLLRTVYQLNRVDLGFSPENKLVVSGSRRGALATGRPLAAINTEIVQRLATLPGVAVLAQTSSAPAGGGSVAFSSIAVETASGPVGLDTFFFKVDADFFAVMEMPFLAGFGFADVSPGGPPVVVISESIARSHFADGNPVGRFLTMNKQQLQIVGVVSDIVMGAQDTGPVTLSLQPIRGQVYTPSSQGPPLPWFNLIMKLQQPLTAEFAAMVRRTVFEVDPSIMLSIKTLDEVIGGWSRQQKQTLVILQLLSALALGLAAFGVFSVTAYSVVQRRRELGIRLVLGATPGGITLLVLRRGLQLGGLGVVIGLVAAASLSRFLTAMLFNTNAYDPLVYVAVAGSLLAATALACWLPAHRAGQVNPMAALRTE